MSPNLDVAVVSSVPLIERFENVNLMPAEMKSPGHEHSAMVRMLLDVNTHFGSRLHSKRMLRPLSCQVLPCSLFGKDFAPFAGAEPTITS